MSKFIHVTTKTKPTFAIVEEQFKQLIEPIYGEQQKQLAKIDNDRNCELYYLPTPITPASPSGILIYKKDLVSEYGVSDAIEIKTLFVIDPEKNSGKGIGKALLFRVFAYAYHMKANNILVTVSKDKEDSVAFFKKFGFSIKKECKDMYKRGSTEYIFAKNIISHTVPIYGEYYNMIKNKIKTKEGRTNSPMFKHLKPHEFITFDNKRDINGILVYVDHVKDYSTFESMLKDGGLKAYLPNTDTIANGVSLYKAIPRYTENEKKYGVVGIEFTVVDKYIDVTTATTTPSILNKKANNNNNTNDNKVKSTILSSLSSNIKRKRNDDDDNDNDKKDIVKKIK